jgi:two-component system, cell cycle response regulator DivK
MPKILLVEDNESNRDLISRYLQIYEYEVIVAEDGEEGLRKACDDFETIDLILMDTNLPEMDGWEVTRRLKADENTKSLPTIAITTRAMVGDRQKALDAGCDDYTPKPGLGSNAERAEHFNTLSHGCRSIFVHQTCSESNCQPIWLRRTM